MGAVTGALLLLLKAGDHLILTDECYHSTLNFCEKFLPRYGVESSLVAHGDYAAIEAAIRPQVRSIPLLSHRIRSTTVLIPNEW